MTEPISLPVPGADIIAAAARRIERLDELIAAHTEVEPSYVLHGYKEQRQYALLIRQYLIVGRTYDIPLADLYDSGLLEYN